VMLRDVLETVSVVVDVRDAGVVWDGAKTNSSTASSSTRAIVPVDRYTDCNYLF
jgi:hypothetical protein